SLRTRVGRGAVQRDVGDDQIRILRRGPAEQDERRLRGSGDARGPQAPLPQRPERRRREERGRGVEGPRPSVLREAAADERRALEREREREERAHADERARDERAAAEIVRELGRRGLVGEVDRREE